MPEVASTVKTVRLEAVDQFRGLAILMMVLVNYLGGVRRVPFWLKHAPDVGLTVADLVAPLFMFAIGLTLRLSVERRLSRTGRWATAQHFVKRFAALAGIGFLMVVAEGWVVPLEGGINWGVLQAIGASGLVALLVIRLPTGVRLAAGLALLGVYQVLLDKFWLPIVLRSPHGGAQGSLGWSAMLILATVLADLYHDAPCRRKPYVWASFATLALGIALSLAVPVSKHRVSASYVLISLGVSGLLYWAFNFIEEHLHLRLPVLSAWGRNPFLLYLLHYALLGVYFLPGIPAWYAEAPPWLVVLQASALVAALSWIAWFLRTRDLVFAL